MYHNYEIKEINSKLCSSYCLYFFFLIKRMNYFDAILKMFFAKLLTIMSNKFFSVQKSNRTIILIVIIRIGVIILLLITYSYKCNNDYTIIHIRISVNINENNIEENIDLSQFYKFECR